MKIILMLLYYEVGFFYRLGINIDLKLLSNTQAKRLGMKNPCLYMRPKFLGRILLVGFGKIVTYQSLIHGKAFGDKPTRGFVAQNFPGNRITKRQKK
jgi:hypothetical protein